MAEKDDDNKGEEKVDFEQLNEAIKGLPEGVQNAMKAAIKEASGDARAAAAAAAKANEDNIEDDPDPEVDVERLSRSELVSHINRSLDKTIAKALKPVLDRLESTTTDAETDRVKREFEKAKDSHSDFMEWKDEMRDIITAHPDLSAERIYRLARSENPEKAKEIDDKIKEDKDKKSGESNVTPMRAFGGLRSTSGKSVENDGKKQPKDAAKSAWDQVMGDVPDSLFGEATEG